VVQIHIEDLVVAVLVLLDKQDKVAVLAVLVLQTQ
jgi:hypothetical protein